MGTKIGLKVALRRSNSRIVFVACGGGGPSGPTCPRINLAASEKSAKIRDDYSDGLKTSKALAKLIFKN